MKTITIALALSLFTSPAFAAAKAKKSPAPKLSTSNISGVVRSVPRRGAARAEGGVWVIAETEDLGTRYAKIVVTDERGRFLIPDLPKASYLVWTRGYGLLDSRKVRATPGRVLEIK